MRFKQTAVVFAVAIALLAAKVKGVEQEPRKTSEQLNSVEVDVGGATSYANVDTRDGAPKANPPPTKKIKRSMMSIQGTVRQKLILRPQKSLRMIKRSMILSVPRRKKLQHREMLFVENILNTTHTYCSPCWWCPYY